MKVSARRLRLFVTVPAFAVAIACTGSAVHAQSASSPDADSQQPDAQADQPPPGSAEIVVTGSRLASGFSTPTPVSVVGAARLESRGATNIGDALNEIPAFRATNTPAGAEFVPNAGYVGGRILDLRGLGSVRTLTLIDGKRFVPSTTQATVDTNMIPSILLQRAEVVTGGASAQYGSDAVAGVANLILDHKFAGLKGSIQNSITGYGDNRTTTAALAFGTRLGDTLHLVIGGEYENSNGTGDCQARAWCRTETLNYGRNPGEAGVNATTITSGVRPSSTPFNGVTVPPSSAYTGRATPVLRPIDGITFNNDGTPRRFEYGSRVNSLFMVGGEGQGQNIYFSNLLIVPPVERYAVTANLDWQVSPSITASFMLNYGHLKSTYAVVPYRNTSITISADNPFIPRSADPTLDIPTLLAQSGATSFQLGKGFDEIGPTPLTTRNDVIRGVVSLDGKLGGNWGWNAYYEYGHNRFVSTTQNHVINSRINNALQAVRNGGGQIVCAINADGSTANDDPACVPFNPFGRQASAASIAYVTGSARQTNVTNEHVIAANVHGDLFSLPYGPVGIAFGGEFRSDKVNGDTDPISKVLGFNQGNGSVISGKINVIEGYLEGEIPLLRGLAFANDLSLNGAIRRTHYSRSSAFSPSSTVDVTTYKYGIVFEPVEAIRFRATKSRDIRAPNISELYGPVTFGQAAITDPNLGGQQTSAALFNGSNPSLQPERANTLTAGVVIKPRSGFLGRFRLSADYYSIKIDNAIATLGAQNIVTRCFQGDAQSCALTTRDPTTNVLTVVRDVLQNVNRQTERGIDFELDYRQPLGRLGNLDLRVLATHIMEFNTVDTVGTTSRAGQTGLRPGTPPGVPDWTVDGMATWALNAFSLTTHVRYINKGFYNAAFVGPESPGYSQSLVNSVNNNSVPSRTYVDMLAQVRVNFGTGREMTVYGGVDNVFDVDPPLIPGSRGTGNNQIFPPQGRTFKVGARISM